MKQTPPIIHKDKALMQGRQTGPVERGQVRNSLPFQELCSPFFLPLRSLLNDSGAILWPQYAQYELETWASLTALMKTNAMAHCPTADRKPPSNVSPPSQPEEVPSSVVSS
jgi:hypothetical protein